jgi:hypothetical protein
MTRDESDLIAGDLAAEVLDVIQTKVIQLHEEGRISSSEGVYIGTSTCARCAAVLIGGQIPISHAATLDKLIASFSKMFASETRTVFEHRLAIEGSSGKQPQKEGKSAWD